jgi:hypothetical protein
VLCRLAGPGRAPHTNTEPCDSIYILHASCSGCWRVVVVVAAAAVLLPYHSRPAEGLALMRDSVMCN